MTDLHKTIKISWSGLRRYEECHQRHLRHSQGKQHPVTNGRIFLPGTVADRVMRAWLESGDPQPGQMVGMVPEMLRKFSAPETDDERADAQYVIKWNGDKGKDRRKVYEFVCEVVTGLEPILLDLVVPYKYQPELSFKVPITIPGLDGEPRSIYLIGYIDIATNRTMVEDEEDEFILYDLKASQDPKYINKTVGQSIFYDIGFGHWIGDATQPKNFAFVAPALEEKVIWSAVTDDDRNAMMARIIAMAHGIWKEQWDPKKSDTGCQYCDVNHACDKWSVPFTKDDAGKNRVSFEAAAARRYGDSKGEV